jgi:phage shock protein C
MQKIYRLTSEKDKKIAGICAGVAEIFKLDPTIVRLALIFLAVITAVGPVVLTYLAGWWLIPEKREIETTDQGSI